MKRAAREKASATPLRSRPLHPPQPQLQPDVFGRWTRLYEAREALWALPACPPDTDTRCYVTCGALYCGAGRRLLAVLLRFGSSPRTLASAL